jgi:hypothetical protein
MRESLDIESVLRAAVQGFVDAFNVEEVNVRLVDARTVVSDQAEDARQRAGGDENGEDGS